MNFDSDINSKITFNIVICFLKWDDIQQTIFFLIKENEQNCFLCMEIYLKFLSQKNHICKYFHSYLTKNVVILFPLVNKSLILKTNFH